VRNGRIKDINLLKAALNKISFIPNLASEVESKLPQRYKEKLKAKDTVLEKVNIDTMVSEGIMFIKKAEVIADGFSLLANGQVDFKQDLALNADLYVPPDLSESMVAASQELKYFLDNSKRIHIPLRSYRGPLSRFKTYPDVEDLGKEVLRNRGKQELKRVLFKALDIDEETSEGAAADGGSSQQGAVSEDLEALPEKSQPSSEDQLIDNILDMIPVFK
jgi:hypothetical protein